jgi:hypothetical protein
MSRYFYDCEFYEDGERVYPLSIGIVQPSGERYYRVYADWMWDSAALHGIRRHAFLLAEVIPHLPQLAQDAVHHGPPSGSRHPDEFVHPVIAPKWIIAQELAAIFAAGGKGNQLWAYYGAYDHLVLSQTFGTMMQLPKGCPMFTHELMQLEEDVNARRSRVDLPPVVRPGKSEEHHAAADAAWDMAFYDALIAGDVPGALLL